MDEKSKLRLVEALGSTKTKKNPSLTNAVVEALEDAQKALKNTNAT